jgi:hypothetical protein
VYPRKLFIRSVDHTGPSMDVEEEVTALRTNGHLHKQQARQEEPLWAWRSVLSGTIAGT